jgi:hypothetical protein
MICEFVGDTSVPSPQTGVGGHKKDFHISLMAHLILKYVCVFDTIIKL